MHNEGEQVHLSEEEASGGRKNGIVRWVLIISLILAIGALSVIWMTGAALTDDPSADNASVGARIAEERDQAADAAAPAAPTAATSADEREIKDGMPVVNN